MNSKTSGFSNHRLGTPGSKMPKPHALAPLFYLFTNTSHNSHPKDGPRAWLLLVYTCSCSVLVASLSYGYGVILPILMETFNENRERTALVGSLQIGMCLLLCVFTSKLCERYTCRIVNGIGLISYVVGLTLSSLCRSIFPLYFTYSLLLGFAAACTYASNFIALRRNFKKHYSFVIGVMTAGYGIGMLSTGPLMQLLTNKFGWENTFRIYAGLFAFLLLFTLTMNTNVIEIEQDKTTETVQTNNSTDASNMSKPHKIVFGFLDLSVWTFPEFTISVIGNFISIFGHCSPVLHLVKYSDELGISPTKGSLLLTFIGIATTLSRLVVGRLCDVMKPRYIQQLGSFLSGISTIMLSFASTYTHLVIFAVFYGIADGAIRVTVNILFMDTVDIPRKPSAFGQANMVTSVANAFGPALAGMMADKSDSYTSAFYIAGATTIFGGMIFFVHLCFFKSHSGQRDQLNIPPVTDHPMARVGLAETIEQEGEINQSCL